MFDDHDRCRKAPSRGFAAVSALALGAQLLTSPAHADPDEEDSGGAISMRYTTDLMTVADGGIDRDTALMGRFDLAVTSGSGFLGIPDARGYLDLMALHGGGFSEQAVGDAQVVSNVDAPSAIRPFEAWIEAPVARGTRIKLGYIDLNSEFDLQPIGASFLNSSFGIAPDFSQSGRNGPSIFPITSPGALLAVERPSWTLRVAAFDAVPGDPEHPRRFFPGRPGRDGMLLVAEGDVKLGGGELQLGGWTYTSRFPRLDRPGEAASYGVYAQYARRLAGSAEKAGLDAWVRVGRAASEVNEIGTYAGGGLRWGTEGSHFGLGIAHASRGDPAMRATPGPRAETAIEATVFHRLSERFAIQPDVQYVRHPGWSGTPDAVVIGVRLHFSTSFDLGEQMR